MFMKKYTVVSSIKADFKCGIDIIWNKVTSLIDYKWRSDINYIEVLGKHRFIEYSNNGVKTFLKQRLLLSTNIGNLSWKTRT